MKDFYYHFDSAVNFGTVSTQFRWVSSRSALRGLGAKSADIS